MGMYLKNISGSAMTLLLGLVLACASQPQAADQDLDSASAVEYIGLVQKHVEDNWSYKKTLDNQFYSIQARVTVDRDGAILDTQVDRVSEDEEFNREALRQLAAMEPFPRFPEAMLQDRFEIRLLLMPNSN